jgi:DNA-directed RNA polymerase subunit RPC12/RpoP
VKDYLDYLRNNEIKCPYCDFKYSDSWELVTDFQDGEVSIECDDCGKTFSCTTEYEISYTTVGTCKKHKLWRYEGSEYSYTCQVCATEFYDFHLEGGKYQKLNKDQYEIIKRGEL